MSSLPDFLTSIVDAFEALLKGIGGGFAGFFESITGGSSFGSSTPEGTTAPETTTPEAPGTTTPEAPEDTTTPDVEPEAPADVEPETPGDDVDAGEVPADDAATEQAPEGDKVATDLIPNTP